MTYKENITAILECYLHSWTIDDVLQRLDSWYAPIVIEADKAGK